jgi:hypothetical protein
MPSPHPTIDAVVIASVAAERVTGVNPYGHILSREDFAKLKAEINLLHDGRATIRLDALGLDHSIARCRIADTPFGEACVVSGRLIIPTKVQRLGA